MRATQLTCNGAYGYEWVPETGLYHVGARAYDPRIARWLQRDPIDASSGDPNLYRYAGNDPVNYRDPTGTEIQDEFTSVTCTRGRMEIVRMALYQSPSQSSQKRVCPITPSLRFPLLAGGTEPTRPTRFPSRSGGNHKEGGNCKLCPCDWY